MTATLNDVAKKLQAGQSAERLAVMELVQLAKDDTARLSLTGPDGLLKQFTKRGVETALDE